MKKNPSSRDQVIDEFSAMIDEAVRQHQQWQSEGFEKDLMVNYPISSIRPFQCPECGSPFHFTDRRSQQGFPLCPHCLGKKNHFPPAKINLNYFSCIICGKRIHSKKELASIRAMPEEISLHVHKKENKKCWHYLLLISWIIKGKVDPAPFHAAPIHR